MRSAGSNGAPHWTLRLLLHAYPPGARRAEPADTMLMAAALLAVIALAIVTVAVVTVAVVVALLLAAPTGIWALWPAIPAALLLAALLTRSASRRFRRRGPAR
ncbi:membrane protein implicated in regulation of membrane protease activity [Catenuloplanes nepalensis]|uniref:Membrane protein implicated in regulation of membrane protease activity n=1 Tax=Catenuloplanes nepalensis TaxID=587533 RepID=A0ABT9MPE8_9ACTN|nr:hypothetical protein [Catenuloplanes nepalensis]MDP9793305.1 membrane protein implicated in regulation of membrane protease activity [Catenuloplanes nepalensis]